MTQRLAERVALVTGGASGIGAATALRLASEGARVAVADIDEAGANGVAAEVEGLGLAVDVTDGAAVKRGLERAERELGPVEIVINCAGGGERFALFPDTDGDQWERELRLNLVSTMMVVHAVLPRMYSRRAGAIVNVASEAGRGAMVGGATYAAAKAGVIGFTKAIARESARRGVRCNAVAPGPVDTPMLERATVGAGDFGSRVRHGMVEATAMGRMGRPEEVAATIAFLASDDAAWITGQTVAVSGGLSMW